MIEIILYIILVVLGVALFVVLAVCAIAPLFITKDMTEGDEPAVKIGQGE